MTPADRPSLETVLAAPDTVVVVVRADGDAAVRVGLPAGVAPDDLPSAVVADPGPPAVVGAALPAAAEGDEGDADEVATRLGPFREPRSVILDHDEPHRLFGAVGYANWLAATRFCPRCGRPTELDDARRTLRCGLGHQHFPRIEPAVIMRVVDADDRLLLARQRVWPRRRFSVLAGFVDPGETLEDCVRREVFEEVGLRVGEVDYVASQPWPFPASLMLGFQGRATTTDVVHRDGEIGETRWLGRDDLRGAMAGGAVQVPPPASIAHRLIAAWYGADGRDVAGDDLLVWTRAR